MNAMVHRHKMTALRLCTFAVVLGALTACEISYKRGASPSTMVSDEQACRAKHDTTAAYQSCMKALGWFISTADPTPQLAALTRKDEKEVSVADLKREMQAESPSPEAPASKNTQAAKPLEAKQKKDRSLTNTEPSPTAEVPQDTPSVTTDESAQLVKISSWWKFGGSPQQLASDQQKCREATGEIESADALLISRSMYQCMRKLGWFGI